MDTSMKVLVVDDFATMRRIIKGVLKQLGFSNIIEAEDGNLALEELKKEEFDFSMLDPTLKWRKTETPKGGKG